MLRINNIKIEIMYFNTPTRNILKMLWGMLRYVVSGSLTDGMETPTDGIELSEILVAPTDWIRLPDPWVAPTDGERLSKSWVVTTDGIDMPDEFWGGPWVAPTDGIVVGFTDGVIKGIADLVIDVISNGERHFDGKLNDIK